MLRASIFCLVFLCELGFSQTLVQKQKIFAEDREVNEHFGYHVQIYDDFAFVGAPTEGSKIGLGGSEEGAVYVLKFDSIQNRWLDHQKLVIQERGFIDNFGSSIDRVGNELVVGANKFGDKRHGAAFVFELQSGYWIEKQKLLPDKLEARGLFGSDVSISNGIIVIGAPFHPQVNNGKKIKQAGIVFVYKKNERGQWKLSQKLLSPYASESGRFGLNVFLDSNLLVVGALQESTDQSNENFLNQAGAAYVYNIYEDGNWFFKQKLTHSDREEHDHFGDEICIENDQIFVSANVKKVNDKSMSGAVYCFEKNNENTWIEKQKIIPPDHDFRNYFGHSVSVEGSVMLASGDYNRGIGAGYIFLKNECGYWVFQQKFTAQNEMQSTTSGDFFGFFLDLSPSHMILSSIYDHHAPLRPDIFEAGSAFIFEYKNFEKIERRCDPNDYASNLLSTFVDSTNFSHSLETIDFQYADDSIFTFTLVPIDTIQTTKPIIVDSLEMNIEVNTFPEFNILPNPNKGIFQIQIIGPFVGVFEIVIMNSRGREVYRGQMTSEYNTVDLGRRAFGHHKVFISQKNQSTELPMEVLGEQ